MNIKMLKLAVIPLMVLALAACGGVMGKGAGGGSGASGGAADNSTNTLIGGDLIGGGANSGAGYGANIPGTGSLTAPTAEAVVARLKNGLEGNANPIGRQLRALPCASEE